MNVRESIRKFVNKFGYEIVKLEDHIAHADRGNWLGKLDIRTIIDIGSNQGQFINQLSRILPGRKIYAFEPIKSCYDKLLVNTKQLNVTAYNTALGDTSGNTEMNISANFVSSSILNMEEVHSSTFPKSGYVNKETIQLSRLDDVMKQHKLERNILVKIDVQGYEEKVLAGGGDTVGQATAVIVETAIKPMYENQWRFDNVYRYFTERGFVFLGFTEQVMMKTTGIPLYADSIFVKKELADSVY